MNLDVPEEEYHPYDMIAKSLAKSLSVKTGTYLSQKEQEALVNDLFSCKEPSLSPEGRATFKTLTLQEIDLLFGS